MIDGTVASAPDDDVIATPTGPLDLTVLQNIQAVEARGSTGLLKKIVGKFVEIAPPFVADIRVKFEARDGDGLWRAAHRLKSSACAIGAVQVAARCAEIELTAHRDGAEAVAASLMEDLETDVTAAIELLLTLLADTDAALRSERAAATSPEIR